MQLTSVRPGDIVQVNRKGRVFLATVTGKEKGNIDIKPLVSNVTYFSASAREVQAHWKKMGRNGTDA